MLKGPFGCFSQPHPALARKALVLLSDLIHESLAAAAAAASGRPTYDGFEHSLRPPKPFWRGAKLSPAVASLLGRSLDVDTREKAVWALRYMHAAKLLSEETDLAPARAALEDVRRAACREDAGGDGSSCAELRRLAQDTLEGWAQPERPAGTALRADETVFDWDI